MLTFKDNTGKEFMVLDDNGDLIIKDEKVKEEMTKMAKETEEAEEE